MESKLSLLKMVCAHKLELIDQLADLSDQHFKLTSTLLDDGSLGSVIQECSKVRAQWVEAERLLSEHVQAHHC
jgi:hypothetical protein